MDDIFTLLKVGLAQELEKQGSNLQELEEALRQINTADGVVKTADILGGLGGLGIDAVKGVGSAAMKLPEFGLLSALMAGSMGGAGAYGIGKHFDNQDKELSDKQNEVDRMKSLTDRLKTDYGIGGHHGQA